MKLSYYCSSCKKENHIKTKTQDRFAFFIEYGSNEINERCKYCGHFTKRHINRLHAEPNNLIIILSFLIALIITILLWDFGFVSTLTATIPLWFWIDQKKKASAFNKTMAK